MITRDARQGKRVRKKTSAEVLDTGMYKGTAVIENVKVLPISPPLPPTDYNVLLSLLHLLLLQPQPL